MKYSKAALPNQIYKNSNYEKMNYRGSAGILFKINHWLLEVGVDKKYNEHILEVGGGAKSHLEFIKSKNIKTYTIIDDKFFLRSVELLKKKNDKINFFFIDYKDQKSIKKIKQRFTRLISSHTFEHFLTFEDSFLKILPLLKKNSLLSIALPCDPGILWRALQFISYFKQKKIYGWKNFKQKDLDDSRDHLTSVQNIIKVFNFYFKNISFKYFPFVAPIVWLNIFLIIQIKLKYFRNKF
jgi:phosphatidylethanolamine/phosphatidyl-N-methylethanolamine N-methyltransferase